MSGEDRTEREDSRRRPQEGARQEDRQEVTQEAMEEKRPWPGGRPQPGGPQEGAPTGGQGQHEPAARQEERMWGCACYLRLLGGRGLQAGALRGEVGGAKAGRQAWQKLGC